MAEINYGLLDAQPVLVDAIERQLQATWLTELIELERIERYSQDTKSTRIQIINVNHVYRIQILSALASQIRILFDNGTNKTSAAECVSINCFYGNVGWLARGEHYNR